MTSVDAAETLTASRRDRMVNAVEHLAAHILQVIQHKWSCKFILGLRMRMMPRATPCRCTLRMRIGHVELRCQKLVGAQERLRLNRAWKVSIIYTWLVKTPQRALFFWTFSCSARLFSTTCWKRAHRCNFALSSTLNWTEIDHWCSSFVTAVWIAAIAYCS